MTSVEREARRGLIARAARNMESAGVNWSEWARDHGFQKHSVMKVVRGERTCLRGECYCVAQALMRAEKSRIVRVALAGPAVQPLPRGEVADSRPAGLSGNSVELLECLETLAGLCETAVVRLAPGCAAQWSEALDRAHRVAERVRCPETGEGGS